jgi:pullulanase/glycogen debranching enzyme
VLRRSRFFTGEINPVINVKDVSWIDANGSEMKAEAWDNERTGIVTALRACGVLGGRVAPRG